MPWSPSDASKFTSKADTPKKQRAWAAAANAALEKHGSDSRAVRAANAAVANMTEDARKRRYGQSRDRFGRELTSWEEFAELELDAMFKKPLVVIVDAPAPATRMMYDAVELDDAAKVSFTADGYMKAMPRIARTGIQRYLGIECGRPELDTVMVYRPETSVFHNDAMHSYSHLPITVDHPRSMVTPDSWRKHAVGETGDDVVRDGHAVRVPMMLRDSKAIQLVKDGKRQLSVGYACDLVFDSGVTPAGEAYDAVQTNIRGNHLAIVTEARGGPILTIGDSDMSETMKTVIIDGLPCLMSDKDAAIVQRTISNLTDAFEAFKKKAKEDEEESDKKCDAMAKDNAKLVEDMKVKDALILTVQQQLKDATDPAKLDAQLAVRDIVRGKAVAIMGPTFKVDGRKIEDVRRDVVVAKSGVTTAKDWGDEAISAVFDHLTSGLQSQPRDPIRDASNAFAGQPGGYNPTNAQAVKDAAYRDMVTDMENAWKPKPAAAA